VDFGGDVNGYEVYFGVRPNCKPVTLIRWREIGMENRFLSNLMSPGVGELIFLIDIILLNQTAFRTYQP
jgi:hypothetical protein